MKYVEEFRRSGPVKNLTERIHRSAGSDPLIFMEVCGTHTMAIARYGIRELLPASVELISGPGCPVCVTPQQEIDRAVALARLPETIVTTFGDMMKVPGSASSLEFEHGRGADIRIVTSTLDALVIAGKNPDRNVVFIGVGFETTAPTVAAAIKMAKERHIHNFSVLSAHKLVPPALKALSEGPLKIDGFLCPGHVSAIIGIHPYEFLPEQYHTACVISGFEPLDILESLHLLIRQVRDNAPGIENQYKRAVRKNGNPVARQWMDDVFSPCDSVWRGIGMIPDSGLKIRPQYAGHDILQRVHLEVEPAEEPAGCRCGEVLRGVIRPPECPLFGKSCLPETPVGACMVSGEGTCAAYYKYQSWNAPLVSETV